MESRITVAIIIMTAVLIGGAVYYVRGYWLRFRELGCTFNYRITDMYAAIVGLLPSIILGGKLIGRTTEPGLKTEDALFWGALVLLLAIYQLCGVVVGRMHLEFKVHNRPHTNLESAASIITGALLSIFYLFGALFIGFFLVLFITRLM